MTAKKSDKPEEIADNKLEDAAGGFSFGASNPTSVGALGIVSPRDPASGQATGKAKPGG